MHTRELAELLWAAIDEQAEELVSLRHEIHRHPEVSGEEAATGARLAEAVGLPVTPVAEHGFVCRAGAPDRPAVAVRTELDALPVAEETGASFASRNGAMHACGHDVHQAAFAGLMRAAAGLGDRLPVPLVGLAQPREETYPSGAQEIAESGLLEANRVRAVLGMHVHPGVPAGCVSTGAGGINASADEFRIEVIGRGGHGAYPHLAQDPVPAAAQIMAGLLSPVRNRVDPMQAATLSIGSVHGGQAANVIPDSIRVTGTVRAMSPEVRALLLAEVERLARAGAEAAGCRAEVEIVRGEPVLENDAGVVRAIDPWLEAAGLRVVEPMRSCGADDFSFFSERLPSAMCFVGVETRGGDPDAHLHSPHFLPPDSSVVTVAKAMAAAYAALACDGLEGRLEGAPQDGLGD